MSTIGPNQNQLQQQADALIQQRAMQNNAPVQANQAVDPATAAIGPQGPVDRGINPRTSANLKLNDNWKSMTAGDSYKMMFGDKPYVSDLTDENLRGMLMEIPDDACPGLKDKAQKGTLKEADIKQLQGFLVAQGYDVGPTGADGKFGPNTHRALEKFLTGQPPDNAAGGAKKPAADGKAQPGTPAGRPGQPAAAGQTKGFMPPNATRFMAPPTSTLPTMEA